LYLGDDVVKRSLFLDRGDLYGELVGLV